MSLSTSWSHSFITQFFVFFVFLAAPRGLGDLSSPTRDWTQAPAVKASSSNHWTTREIPYILLSNGFFFWKTCSRIWSETYYYNDLYITTELGGWVGNLLSHFKLLEQLLLSFKKKLSVMHDQVTSGQFAIVLNWLTTRRWKTSLFPSFVTRRYQETHHQVRSLSD